MRQRSPVLGTIIACLALAGSVGSAALHPALAAENGKEKEKETVLVCHGENGQAQEMEVPVQTLEAHLGHGDTEGPCPAGSSSSSSSVESPVETVLICHGEDGQAREMEVPAQTLDAHLGHGDTEGPCPASSSSSSESASSQESSHGHEPGTPPEHAHGGGSRAVEDSWTDITPVVRGHGLGEHAAALDFVLDLYGLQPDLLYKGARGADPLPPTASRSVREHGAICSMYRYSQRLLEARPTKDDAYVEWIAQRLADALGEDPVTVRDALLGKPHVSPSMSIDEGCAAQAYTNAAGSPEGAIEPQLHEHGAVGDTPHLTVENRSTDGEIAFLVRSEHGIFTDYEHHLTKEMHVIIVRSDLRTFDHVHPDRDDEGVWRVPFHPERGGTYWVYANFSDREGHSYVLRFERTYPGDPGITGMVVDQSPDRDIDGYTVHMDAREDGEHVAFTYTITDAEGTRVRLRPHMGAFGHVVLVSPEGAFSHIHPSLRAGSDPVFYLPLPEPGLFRVFAQFWIGDALRTVVFDWTH